MVSGENTCVSESATVVGLNTNIQVGGQVLHVQTEDFGRHHPAIVTHVFAPNGQVTRVVRFDYSKHVDHPSLRSILPRAMNAQHTAVVQQLQAEAGNPVAPPPDVTPAPALLDEMAPESTPGPECVHQQVEPALWDRLLARVQRERALRRSGPLAAIRSDEETTVRGRSGEGAMPRQELGKEHSWDAAVEHARRISSELACATPPVDPTSREDHPQVARSAFEEGRALLRAGQSEDALVKLALAVHLEPREMRYRAALLALLSRLRESAG